MAGLRATAAMRRSRRRRPAKSRRHPQPDVRATVRRALRTGGEPIRRAWYAPTLQPRRLVLLCDVSGSMDPYSRALLRFMHAAVAGRRRVEAFTMGTRLTRLTRELLSRDPDQALRRAGAAVPDWSGGTRLGDTLRDYNDEWGMRGMSRGAVVVILSDGWERGDPTVIADQMARLSRRGLQGGVGQPTQGVAWLRPPGPRYGRSAAVHRRIHRRSQPERIGRSGRGHLEMTSNG